MQSRGDKTRVVCSRGRSRTLRVTRFANYTSRTYVRMTVMEGSGKSRMCLQHGGNLKVPYTYMPRNGSLPRPRFPSKPISVMRCVIILNDSSVFESIPSITRAMRSLFRERMQYVYKILCVLFSVKIFLKQHSRAKFQTGKRERGRNGKF